MTGYRSNRLSLLATVLITGGCCTEPKDPEDPAATEQAKFVEGWLDDLKAGRDDAARSKLRERGQWPDGWEQGGFSKRVDRLGILRSVDEIRWTAAHYRVRKADPDSPDPLGEKVLTCISNVASPLRLEGTLEAGGAEHPLQVTVSKDEGFRLGDMKVDGKRLVPSNVPRVVKAPVQELPPDELLSDARLDRHFVGQSAFIRATSPHELPRGRSAKLLADCEYGDRWYRHVIVSSIVGPLGLSLPIRSESPTRCSVDLRLSEGTSVRARSWCWSSTGAVDGACAQRASSTRRSDDPVFVDNVTTRISDNGFLSVGYDLYPNEVLPPTTDPASFHLATTLSCDGAEPRKATRPLNPDQHPPGRFRTFASLFDEQADAVALPCNLTLELVESSPYERKKWNVFEGCATASGVDDAACPDR